MIKKGIDGEKKNLNAYNLIEKYIIVKSGLEIKITGSHRKINNISSRYRFFFSFLKKGVFKLLIRNCSTSLKLIYSAKNFHISIEVIIEYHDK